MNSIKNVAIIMDGNGRWAKNRAKPRVWGHIKGASTVSKIVKSACELDLEGLTLYAFSTENWSRPTDEVTNLFKLLKKFLKKEHKHLMANNIKFDVIGNYRVLDTDIVDLIGKLKFETKSNTGLILTLAINYGGKSEIVDAVNNFLKTTKTREITEEDINDHLLYKHDVDLLIRTAGDQRISNFLLWQVAYAEMFFTHTKWPDFTANEFKQIIEGVNKRERRFGSVLDEVNTEASYKKSKDKAFQNLKILG